MTISSNRTTRYLLRRRAGEVGLTLIELLLSLALLAVLTGFIVGGQSMARHALAVDAANAVDAQAEEAIHSIMNLVATAQPVLNKDQSVVFEGSREQVRFVALSEGRSLPGGLYQVALRQIGSELIAEVGSWPTTATQDRASRASSAVVVLRGIRAAHFSYFGNLANTESQSDWRKAWGSARALPRLFSLRIEFEDGRRNGPASVIALRND